MGNKYSTSIGRPLLSRVDNRAGKKKHLIIKKKLDFPVQIQEIIEEYHKERPRVFVSKVCDELDAMIDDKKYKWRDNEHYAENIKTSFDTCTEIQIETIIRFFPKIYWRLHRLFSHSHRPVYYLKSKFINLATISFMPLLVQLAPEFGQFKKSERGGMVYLYYRYSGHLVPRLSVRWTLFEELSTNLLNEGNVNNEYLRRLDETLVCVMKRLREMNIFKKDDIQKYKLIHKLLESQQDENCGYFPELRLRFLLEMDPSYLATRNPEGFTSRRFWDRQNLPLHCSVGSCRSNNNNNMIEFKILLEIGCRYYPAEEGFLSHSNNNGETPFFLACRKYGKDIVMNMLLSDQEFIGQSVIYMVLQKDPIYLLSKELGCSSSQNKNVPILTGRSLSVLEKGKAPTLAPAPAPAPALAVTTTITAATTSTDYAYQLQQQQQQHQLYYRRREQQWQRLEQHLQRRQQQRQRRQRWRRILRIA